MPLSMNNYKEVYMTREQALEWLLKQALRSLNGLNPGEGIFIKASCHDNRPFSLWKWEEGIKKTYTGDKWLPGGIKYDFIDQSKQIGNQLLTMPEVIEIGVRELTRDALPYAEVPYEV